MTAEERSTLLKRAITTYGTRAQADMAVEEMAELTKAICKTRRAQPGPELAAAVDADFVRGTFHGVYVGDGGFYNNDFSKLQRRLFDAFVESCRR